MPLARWQKKKKKNLQDIAELSTALCARTWKVARAQSDDALADSWRACRFGIDGLHPPNLVLQCDARHFPCRLEGWEPSATREFFIESDTAFVHRSRPSTKVKRTAPMRVEHSHCMRISENFGWPAARHPLVGPFVTGKTGAAGGRSPGEKQTPADRDRWAALLFEWRGILSERSRSFEKKAPKKNTLATVLLFFDSIDALAPRLALIIRHGCLARI